MIDEINQEKSQLKMKTKPIKIMRNILDNQVLLLDS